MIVISLDIETTGDRIPIEKWDVMKNPQQKDALFAIGYAYGTDEDHIIEAGRIVRSIKPKDSTISWKEHWKNKGWERHTGEWWWKHKKVLNELQTSQMINAQNTRDMMRQFNDVMQKVKSICNNELTIVSDTSTFDLPWLCALLEYYNFPSMSIIHSTTDADNIFIRAVNVKSYISGLVDSAHTCFGVDKDAMKKRLQMHGRHYISNCHDPQYDALNIIYTYFHAVKCFKTCVLAQCMEEGKRAQIVGLHSDHEIQSSSKRARSDDESLEETNKESTADNDS